MSEPKTAVVQPPAAATAASQLPSASLAPAPWARQRPAHPDRLVDDCFAPSEAGLNRRVHALAEAPGKVWR